MMEPTVTHTASQAVEPPRQCSTLVCLQNPSPSSDEDPEENFFEVEDEPLTNLPWTHPNFLL
ncbi:hypothetical protein DSO57_1011693 [Entomophthora muscae]|uniref:Uncharacterized protein n=1 Tax=Entomophthora muscae TaxID=34485 RepID=A0ACC2TTF2_9FUNG|nr:hypothetical protein DSO57_1011693 [Entomophthora muscae]